MTAQAEDGVRASYSVGAWALHPCVRGAALIQRTPWSPVQRERVTWSEVPPWWPVPLGVRLLLS